MGPLHLITTCELWEHPASLVSAHVKLKFDVNVAGKVTNVWFKSKILILCQDIIFFSPPGLTPPPTPGHGTTGRAPLDKSWGSGQWLWLFYIPGQAKSWLRPKVRPGFWLQARAGTSLLTSIIVFNSLPLDKMSRLLIGIYWRTNLGQCRDGHR